MSALPSAKRGRHEEEPIVVPREVVARVRQSLAGPGPAETARGTSSFLLLSWNIDGIDETRERDRMLRCLAVAEHIAATQPAIVMLQEAVPPILELLLAPQLLGNHYEVICPENPSMPYYCVFLLHEQRVQKLAAARTRHFASSRMGRHFLAVDVSVDAQTDASLTFVTTHLESMKTEKAERVKQFTEVLLAIGDAGLKGRTVVLAGDLNIRDDEVVAARHRAREKSPQIDNIVDVWTWCGSPKGQEFTWDTSENTNLGVLYKSRCRFNRFFLSSGVTDGKGISRGKFAEGSLSNCKHVPNVAQWAATDFTLVGQSQVEGLGRFPSDHWGLQINWVLPSTLIQGQFTKNGIATGSGTASAAGALFAGSARPSNSQEATCHDGSRWKQLAASSTDRRVDRVVIDLD